MRPTTMTAKRTRMEAADYRTAMEAKEKKQKRAAMPLHLRLEEIRPHLGSLSSRLMDVSAELDRQVDAIRAGRAFCPTDITRASRRLREAANQFDAALTAAMEHKQ